jgi:hypothetical protein
MSDDLEAGDDFVAHMDVDGSDDDTHPDGEDLESDDDSLVKILHVPPPTAGIHELRKVVVFPCIISSV